MFKPLTRNAKTSPRPSAGFAETQFVHHADDDDYSGFAPTQLFGDDDELLRAAPVDADPHAAASRSRTALKRAARGPVGAEPSEAGEPSIPQSWVTSQWVAAQEAKAHEAAAQARAVIAAQRRADEQVDPADPDVAPTAPRTGLGRLRAAFEKLLPGEFRSLLPLFVGVTVTVATISAVLPMIDKP